MGWFCLRILSSLSISNDSIWVIFKAQYIAGGCCLVWTVVAEPDSIYRVVEYKSSYTPYYNDITDHICPD